MAGSSRLTTGRIGALTLWLLAGRCVLHFVSPARFPYSSPPLKALSDAIAALAAALSISVRGLRPSWSVGRRRPRWCALMATSNTCVRLSIIASPRSFDDGRQRANPGDGSDKDGGWFAAAGQGIRNAGDSA